MKKKNSYKNKKYTSSIKSYNPSINLISSLRSNFIISEFNNIFKCKKDFISVNNKCYKWNRKIVERHLLKKILKKHINYNNVIGPKQYKSNCWFNVFLMVFFVSDKGRKFHRFFRKAMLEGKIYFKTNNFTYFEKLKFIKIDIPKELKYPFFMLNYYIEMCLQGKIKNIKINKKFNTNNIIELIYNSINNVNIFNVNESGNPLYYYESIFNFLLGSKENNPIYSVKYLNLDLKNVILNVNKLTIIPKIIFLKYTDNNTFKKYKNIYINNINYKLDSIVLRSNNKEHFSCYITCNNLDYGFDGASNRPLQKFEWKNKINKNIDFKFRGLPKEINFNFTKGYSIFIYYRN